MRTATGVSKGRAGRARLHLQPDPTPAHRVGGGHPHLEADGAAPGLHQHAAADLGGQQSTFPIVLLFLRGPPVWSPTRGSPSGGCPICAFKGVPRLQAEPARFGLVPFTNPHHFDAETPVLLIPSLHRHLLYTLPGGTQGTRRTLLPPRTAPLRNAPPLTDPGCLKGNGETSKGSSTVPSRTAQTPAERLSDSRPRYWGSAGRWRPIGRIPPQRPAGRPARREDSYPAGGLRASAANRARYPRGRCSAAPTSTSPIGQVVARSRSGQQRRCSPGTTHRTARPPGSPRRGPAGRLAGRRAR